MVQRILRFIYNRKLLRCLGIRNQILVLFIIPAYYDLIVYLFLDYIEVKKCFLLRLRNTFLAILIVFFLILNGYINIVFKMYFYFIFFLTDFLFLKSNSLSLLTLRFVIELHFYLVDFTFSFFGRKPIIIIRTMVVVLVNIFDLFFTFVFT